LGDLSNGNKQIIKIRSGSLWLRPHLMRTIITYYKQKEQSRESGLFIL
jgi:hypothetical protein